MYEASFGLKRRPFAATPDATCFLSAGPIQGVLDELVVCVEQGQGIAVLTAPAGTGKTLLCERLRFELDDRFETVFLRHASFLTRRAFLQTVLCELNYAYHHPSEQELRLELFPAIRALQPKREALVLICDEAHQLTDSLLEELRILADFAEFGRPLVRLVLVGQLSLEEKLAQPSLEAFNQRIRAHVSLSTFDHAESLDYIDYRLTWAGGRTDEVFTPEALDLIARASDGVPRCINQLADHSLLLAFVAEQRPAGENLVREALNDLRQLPLHWNEPPQSLSSSDHSERIVDELDSQEIPIPLNRDSSGYLADSTSNAASYSYEPEVDSDKKTVGLNSLMTDVVPPPAPREQVAFDRAHTNEAAQFEVGSDDWRQTMELFNPRKTEADLVDAMKGLIPESPSPTADDRNSKLTRRIQFHDLLQDAYAAASYSLNDANEHDEANDDDFDQNSDTVEIPWDKNTDIYDRSILDRNSPTVTADLNSLTIKAPHGFQEEIIVDRYTSIDAGFEPSETSLSDTTSSREVHVEQSFTNDHSGEFSVQPANIGSLGHNQFIGVDSHSGSIQGHRYGTESVAFGSNIPAPHSSGLRADAQTDTSYTNLMELNSPSWNDEEQGESNPASNTDRATGPNGVDQIAKDVYSLGESLRSTGMLSSNSDSVLKTLRYEVEGTNKPHVPESSIPASPVSSEAAWEAIETPAVEPTVVEARPFRYLFSMLRRKQQGLS